MFLDRKAAVLWRCACTAVIASASTLGTASVAGCGDDDPVAAAPTEPEEPQVKQARARLRAPDRYVRDLATALELTADEICTEVGGVPCAEAHRIALGGTDAYGASVYQPFPLRSASTAAAYDRLALAACDQRAALDFEALGSASLFGPLANDGPEARREVSTRLYRALLRREPSGEEVAALASFDAADVAGDGGEARAFALGACFAVASSVEALFY